MADLPLAKKSLGQHWLNDDAALQAMVDAAETTAEDTIVEIGPGPGALTKLLVSQAGHVIAIEYDEMLVRMLPQRVPADNLNVVTEDILRFDWTAVPPDYKVAANIPYYLTSNLIRVMSETPNRPTVAALLVQKEVAERVAAEPGDMSILSVTAQFYWQVRLGMVVPAASFTPPPKVDSQILILERLDRTLFPDVDPKEFFRLVKAGFSQRRKTLSNSLSGGLHIDKSAVRELCDAAQIDPARRAQTLDLTEWYNLYQIHNLPK